MQKKKKEKSYFLFSKREQNPVSQVGSLKPSRNKQFQLHLNSCREYRSRKTSLNSFYEVSLRYRDENMAELLNVIHYFSSSMEKKIIM